METDVNAGCEQGLCVERHNPSSSAEVLHGVSEDLMFHRSMVLSRAVPRSVGDALF